MTRINGSIPTAVVRRIRNTRRTMSGPPPHGVNDRPAAKNRAKRTVHEHLPRPHRTDRTLQAHRRGQHRYLNPTTSDHYQPTRTLRALEVLCCPALQQPSEDGPELVPYEADTDTPGLRRSTFWTLTSRLAPPVPRSAMMYCSDSDDDDHAGRCWTPGAHGRLCACVQNRSSSRGIARHLQFRLR